MRSELNSAHAQSRTFRVDSHTQKHLPDSSLGLTILLMWFGLVVLAISAYGLFR